MRYVYLIQSMENGYYKIGVSKHPNLRLKQLNTGNPSITKLVETYQSTYAFKIENTLQHLYTHLKKNGEWFELSLNEEFNFISNCKKIEKNFNSLNNSENVFI